MSGARSSESFSRRIALHADDFGMNAAVSQGILHAFRAGLLTSTSVLANAPDCSPALASWPELLRDQRAGYLSSASTRHSLGDSGAPFDLGIHINLTQGRPLTGDRYPAELLDSQGRFPGIVPVFRKLCRPAPRFHAAITAELAAQIETLLDHGISPTHFNGHQYVEILPAVSATLPELIARFGLPMLRVARETGLARTTLFRGQVANWCLALVKRRFADRFQTFVNGLPVQYPAAFFGTSHAGRINLSLIRDFLRCLPGGLTEIGLHPAVAARPDAPSAIADGWADPLADCRPAELRLLTDPELANLLTVRNVGLGRLAETRLVRSCA